MQFKPYQTQIINEYADARYVALWLEQRLGKTIIAAGLLTKWNAKIGLYVCPAKTHLETIKKLRIWAPQISFISYQDIPDQELTKYLTTSFIICSYGFLNKITDLLKTTLFRQFNFDAIVFDESHNLNSTTTLQSKNAKIIAKYSNRCIDMSATPIKNHPAEIYIHLWLMFHYYPHWKLGFETAGTFAHPSSPYESLKFTHYNFQNAFFTFRRLPFNSRIRILDTNRPYLNDERKAIYQKLVQLQAVVKKRKDVQDELDDICEKVHWIIPDKTTMVFFDDVLNTLGGKISPNGTLVEMNLTSAPLAALSLARSILECGDAIFGLINPKTASLLELIANFSETILIYTHRIAYAEYLQKKIPNSVVLIGKDSDKLFQQKMQDFQNNKYHVGVASFEKVKEGFTLDNVSWIIFTDLPWTWASLDQAKKRFLKHEGSSIHDSNKKRRITYLLSDCSFTHKVYDLIAKKKKFHRDIETIRWLLEK